MEQFYSWLDISAALGLAQVKVLCLSMYWMEGVAVDRSSQGWDSDSH